MPLKTKDLAVTTNLLLSSFSSKLGLYELNNKKGAVNAINIYFILNTLHM